MNKSLGSGAQWSWVQLSTLHSTGAPDSHTWSMGCSLITVSVSALWGMEEDAIHKGFLLVACTLQALTSATMSLGIFVMSVEEEGKAISIYWPS